MTLILSFVVHIQSLKAKSKFYFIQTLFCKNLGSEVWKELFKDCYYWPQNSSATDLIFQIYTLRLKTVYYCMKQGGKTARNQKVGAKKTPQPFSSYNSIQSIKGLITTLC